jgi:aminoglycoside 6'-N-acetyltransferase
MRDPSSSPSGVPTLLGERVVLRPVGPADRVGIRAILAEPSVARWWGATDSPDQALDDWLAPDDDTTAFAIEADGELVGSLLISEEADPDYRHAGLDLFLATTAQGRGLGPDAIRTAARWLFDERGHHRLTIDPSAENARAIAVYERVGFRRVGIMRRYERGPDGTFHDGVLMDLLREDLR